MSEPTEESPLLDPRRDADPQEPNDPYRRFSTRERNVILAVISWTGIIPLFTSGSFIPSIPQIAQDLDSTAPVISLAISLSIFGTAVGSLTFAAYSGFYGRRPVYVYGLPIFCIGSLGVAFAQNVTQVMMWRFLQAFGASGALSVGGAVIGDIYQLEERGSAMGIFFAACLLGPALAPFTGGVAAHYFSWRHLQYGLFFHGFTAFMLVAFLLPETSHPNSRGIDKLIEVPGGLPRPWKWVWINPFRSLLLLRNLTLLAVCLAGSSALLPSYVLLIPLAYTIGKQYHITNEALIGACFLPSGLGNLFGAPLAGRISDYMVVKWKKRRGGVWVPEDRLRTTLWGAGVFIPLTVLASGLLTQYVEGNLGLFLNLVCLFLNGLGVDLVLSPSATYTVDTMYSRSAEVMAVNSGSRSIILSIAATAIFPLINSCGVVVTNAIAAILAWLGFLILWYTIRHGERMRAWSNIENN